MSRALTPTQRRCSASPAIDAMPAPRAVALEQLPLRPLEPQIELRLKAHRASDARIEFRAERAEQLAAPDAREHELLIARRAALHQRREQARRGRIDVGHAFEVEHADVEPVAALDDLAHDALHR